MGEWRDKSWLEKHYSPILFLAGLAGIFYETIATTQDRPFLLAVYAGMAGVLPADLVDQALRRRDRGRLQQEGRDTDPPTR